MSVLIEALRNAEAARIRGEVQPSARFAAPLAGVQGTPRGRRAVIFIGVACAAGLVLVGGWTYLQMLSAPVPNTGAAAPIAQPVAAAAPAAEPDESATAQPSAGVAPAAADAAKRPVRLLPRAVQPAARGSTVSAGVSVADAAPSAEAPAKGQDAKPTPVVVATAPQESALALAYRAWLAGNVAEAGRLYELALAQTPGHPDALLGLAAVAERLGQREAAIAGYRRVLQADPENVEALAALAELTAVANSGAQASALRIALARRPDAPSLHAALGRLLASEERWSEARQAFESAYALAPQRADYAFN
ncbi:MAG: tetratricopeptide repeat protein, partial [Burkholderiaceae bacterium]|nr:tetratricopeptide repeat protein [Burkholderiaceae bacterium]